MYKKILFGRRCDNGKNKKPSNKVKGGKIKSVYTTYQVSGLNFPNLLNKLKKEDIELYEVSLIKPKVLCVSIKISDEQKFFAITKNLCYNIKKVNSKGKLLFLYNLLHAPSLCIGAVLFIALSILFSNVILGFSFVGNGNRYKNQVVRYLNDNGVKEMGFIAGVDLEKLSDGILSEFNEFSFVSCKKNGTRLLIELVLSENQTHIKDTNQKHLYSTVSGVVEEVKVYRGTKAVEIGDLVEEGDILVSGYMDFKDKRVEVNALAVVTIKAKKEFLYLSDSEFDEGNAEAFALASFVGEADSLSVDKSQKNGKYYYKVTVYYKMVMYTG